VFAIALPFTRQDRSVRQGQHSRVPAALTGRPVRLALALAMAAGVIGVSPSVTSASGVWQHESDRVLEDARLHLGQPYARGTFGGWQVSGGKWVQPTPHQNLGIGMDCKDFVSVVMGETGHWNLVGTTHHASVSGLALYWKDSSDPTLASNYDTSLAGPVGKGTDWSKVQPGDIIIYGDPWYPKKSWESQSLTDTKRLYAHAAIYAGSIRFGTNRGKAPAIIHEVPGGVSYYLAWGTMSPSKGGKGMPITVVLHTGLSTMTASQAALPVIDYPVNKLSPYAETSYYPLSGLNGAPAPQRVLDTRPKSAIGYTGGPLSGGQPITFHVAGRAGVPSTATAITGNLTVVAPTSGDSIYLGPTRNPAGQPAPTSIINFATGQTVATGLTMGLASDGTLSATFCSRRGCPSDSNTANLLLDVTGYFTRDMNGSTYHTINAAMLVDTTVQKGLTSPLVAATSTRFQVTGDVVPAGATAVTGEMTVLNDPTGYALYLGPVASSNPSTSSLNFPKNAPASNTITVGLGADGGLYATYLGTGTADFRFVVTGYFTPDMTGDRYVPLTPVRIVDTRTTADAANMLTDNVATQVQVSTKGGVLANAVAVTASFCVVAPDNAGSFSLGPIESMNPAPLTVDVAAKAAYNMGATIGLGADGSLSAAFSGAGNTNLVIDITGYFTPPYPESTYHALNGQLSEDGVAMLPSRVFDTTTASVPPLTAMQPLSFPVAGQGGVPMSATAVTGILTVSNATNSYAMYLGPVPTASPATSTMNFARGQTISNSVAVALGAGGSLSVNYLASGGSTADVTFDVTGYFSPYWSGSTYYPIDAAKLVDTTTGLGLTTRLSAGALTRFPVTGDLVSAGVPAGATAVTVDITVKNDPGGRSMYVGPDDGSHAPSTTTLAVTPGVSASISETVGLNPDGSLLAYYSGSGSADLFVTITGYFANDQKGYVYVPLSPSRLVDTRYGIGLASSLKANVPAVVQTYGRCGLRGQAVTANFTVVAPTGAGSLVAGPTPFLTDLQPLTMAVASNDVKANAATVELAADGTFTAGYLAAGFSANLVVDVTGYFSVMGASDAGASPGFALPATAGVPDVPSDGIFEGYGVGDDA
jgi:hypothetical protein